MRWLTGYLLALLILLSPLGAAAYRGDSVDSIAVTVTSGGEKALPAKVTQRMEASVRTIGENVVAGRAVADVTARREGYEALIREVFGRILVGYSVQSVRLEPGVATVIQVRVKPWGDVIGAVGLDTEIGGVPPAMAELARRDMSGLKQIVDNVLVGLPVDAVEWAGGIVKMAVQEYLAEHLPEFKPSLEIIPGANTVVKIALMPRGKIIRDVNLSVRSDSIPNLILLNFRSQMEARAKELAGLPVAFVERHQAYFAARLRREIVSDRLVKRYGLTAELLLDVDSHTDVTVNVDTHKYKITLEGYLDVGREKDNTTFRLHAGRILSGKDEAFVEVDFMPNSISWEVMPGWAHKLSQRTVGGIKYNLSDGHEILWLNQSFSKNWMLRLEHSPSRETSEVGLRYKLHDFVSLEYVMNDDEKWLRVIGDF